MEAEVPGLGGNPRRDRPHALRPRPSLTASNPAPQPRPKSKISAAAIIPIWIVLSSGVIIYNNYLYNTMQFKYPVFLVTWHLTFAVSCFYHRSLVACF